MLIVRALPLGGATKNVENMMALESKSWISATQKASSVDMIHVADVIAISL